MAIFGMADLVLWWVGIAKSQIYHRGGWALRVQRVVISNLVQWVDGSGQWWWCLVGIAEREQHRKILREKM
jgi:hypothetical protein